jgi:hypothetical protein
MVLKLALGLEVEGYPQVADKPARFTNIKSVLELGVQTAALARDRNIPI